MAGAKDRVKGATSAAKGKVQRKVGKATGNRSMQAKGVASSAKGKVQKAVGKAKRAVKRATK